MLDHNPTLNSGTDPQRLDMIEVSTWLAHLTAVIACQRDAIASVLMGEVADARAHAKEACERMDRITDLMAEALGVAHYPPSA